MALIQTVHLSMANFKSAPVVPAVQNDTDRQVKMVIDDFDLTAGLTGKITFVRSDGTHYEASATLDVATNSFTADIDQALTQPGRTMVQLKVTDTLTVSTFSFVIFVEEDTSGTVTPQEGIDLVTAVEAAEDAADRAESAAEDAQEQAALVDAPAIWDAIESMIVSPENTNFADRIESDSQYVSFSDSGLGIVKYASLVPYNGNFITSNGSDSWLFRLPYYGFTFGIDKLNTAVYRLGNTVPEATAGESVGIVETLTGTESGSFNIFTVNEPKGTIILFTKLKSYPDKILTTMANHFTESGLELNDIQDTFARYSVRGGSSNVTPTVTKLAGKLVNTTTGGVSDNASYDTYYIYCPISSMYVTCTNGFRCVLTTLAPELINENGYFVSVVYANADSRVDTFEVSLGQYAVFSLSHAAQPNIDLKTDYIKTFTLPTLRLDYGQKNGFYKIETSGDATYIYIYYVSGDKVVGWELHNAPSSGINSDTWQLGHVMGYDFDGRLVSNGVELVSGGEFELAFKEYGTSDYCGGNNHGDENQVDFVLLIDGEAINTASADGNYHAFDRIDAVEHAIVNRCDTPNDDILKHQKIWVFENGTVKVRQTLEFLQTMECDFLCCMLAANRSYFKYGVRQGRVGVEDMSTNSFPDVSTGGNEMMYLMYGINASAKVTAKTCDHTPLAQVWVNPASTINKLYYNFYGQRPRTEVASGTVVWWEQEYDIAYN